MADVLHSAAERLMSLGSLARRLPLLWVSTLVLVVVLLGGAWLAGWRLRVVESGSMAPAVPRDALAVITPVDAKQVKIDDVVSFRYAADGRLTVLHRVFDVLPVEGGRVFQTKGDSNTDVDRDFVGGNDLQGKLRWSVPQLGAIARALRPPLGLIVLVGLPLAGFLSSGTRRRLLGRSSEGIVRHQARPSRTEFELLACM
jgi:signal peptidase